MKLMHKNKISKSKYAQGVGLAAVSSFFYGTYGVWSRLMSDDFGAFSQAAIRSSIVVLILLLVTGLTGKLEKFHVRKNKLWLTVSVTSSVLTAAPIYYAMNAIGIGASLVIFYASYCVSMQLFEYIEAKRLPIFREFATIALALAGLLLIYQLGGTAIEALGFMAALVSGVATGFNVLASKNIRANSATTTLVAWASGLIVSIPTAVVIGDSVPALSSSAWLYILLFAVSSVVSSWSVISAVKKINTGLVGLIGQLEIVFGIVFGTVFFHEVVTVAMIAGALLIIIAATVPNIYELRNQKG